VSDWGKAQRVLAICGGVAFMYGGGYFILDLWRDGDDWAAVYTAFVLVVMAEVVWELAGIWRNAR
jgi:hypothetical protein